MLKSLTYFVGNHIYIVMMTFLIKCPIFLTWKAKDTLEQSVLPKAAQGKAASLQLL